ncbi:hypothetical protein ABIB82_004053 [Bradyrhizobium sp. i1.8.4]|uniref:hypothetical protein n=1 Tax=unclassified Bradyrhizobium TaxID=2631580 RepID=UPI003D22E3F3
MNGHLDIEAIAAALEANRDELRRERAESIAQIVTLTARVERIDRLLDEAIEDGPTVGDDDLISSAEAAERANRDQQTIRRWCEVHGIGVKVAGRWEVSTRRLHDFQRRSKKPV